MNRIFVQDKANLIEYNLKYVASNVRSKIKGVETYPIGNGQVIVSRIPPFMLKSKEETYFFSGLKIFTEITETKNGAQINLPQIWEPKNYNHPFVRRDNTICYDDEDLVWKVSGVDPKPQKDFHQKEFTEMICKIIRHAEIVLTRGYNENVTPIKTLNEENFAIEREWGRKIGRST